MKKKRGGRGASANFGEFFDRTESPVGPLNAGEINEGRNLIAQGPTNLDATEWIIGPKSKMIQRPTDKSFKWSYASYYRPLMHGIAGNVIEQFFEVASVEGTHWSIVYTKEPLAIDAIFKLELTPLWKAMGRFIYDFARAQNLPVELGKIRSDGHTSAATLFRNPRGLWQISYFDAEVGPTGHDEQEAKPWELVQQAWENGYRRWSPGVVDSIMETVK